MGTNTLYYPWCFTKAMLPEIETNYETILKQIGIDFIKLSAKEYCCGSPVLRAGCRKDFEDIKEKNIAIFKQHAVWLIITNCPACYNMFKYEYKLPDHGIKVEHITQTLKRYKKKLKKKEITKEAVYHDPCHLGRLSGVYEEPRELIQWCGYKIKEFKKNREHSPCCGGGGGLINNNPDLSDKIGNKVLDEIKNETCMTSPCPMCYYQFKQHAKKIDVKEFSDIVLEG